MELLKHEGYLSEFVEREAFFDWCLEV